MILRATTRIPRKENRPALEGVLEEEHVVVVLPLALVGLGLLSRALFFP